MLASFKPLSNGFFAKFETRVSPKRVKILVDLFGSTLGDFLALGLPKMRAQPLGEPSRRSRA